MPSRSGPSGPAGPTSPRPEDLSSPATQIVRNRADYLGEGQYDVGQRVSDDKLELFVSTDPAQALLHEFSRHTPDYIALHDLGGSGSLRLLAAVAGALGGKLQQLAIRRQGHGVALATLRFVEVPGRGKHKLRVYTTDADADTHARRELASVLLGHAKLGVLMVDDLPSHALINALQPVQESIRKGPWPNRNLLLVPRGPAKTVAAQASALVSGSSVYVNVTAQAAQANDAWTYITGAWNRLRDVPPAPPASAPAGPASASAAASAAPRPMPPTAPAAHAARPAAPRPSPAIADPVGPWPDYIKACNHIKGLVSACLFDSRTMRVLAHNNARPDPQRLMTQGMALYTAMVNSGRTLGLGGSQPDASISLAAHHLLLHPLPGQAGLLLHAVLDGAVANPTLARMQLQRVDTLVLGAPAKT